MKRMKRWTAIIASFILSLPYMLMAQDSGTYIDNLNSQDSSYMQQDISGAAEKSSSGSTAIIIIVVVVVIAVVAFILLRKKKK